MTGFVSNAIRSALLIGLSAFIVSPAASQDFSVCKSLADNPRLIDRLNISQNVELQYQDFLAFCSEKSNRVDRAKRKSFAWRSAAQYAANGPKGTGNADAGDVSNLTEASLDRACTTGAHLFRENIATEVSASSGSVIGGLFVDCLKVLADANLDVIGGDVEADTRNPAKFHVLVHRAVRDPSFDFYFVDASPGISCVPVGAPSTPEPEHRLVKYQLGLACEAAGSSGGPINGMLSFRGLDHNNQITPHRREVWFEVTPKTVAQQIAERVEQQVSVLVEDMKRSKLPCISKTQDFIYNHRPSVKLELPKEDIDRGYQLIGGGCSMLNDFNQAQDLVSNIQKGAVEHSQRVGEGWFCQAEDIVGHGMRKVQAWAVWCRADIRRDPHVATAPGSLSIWPQEKPEEMRK